MPHQFPVFEMFLNKRGRGWTWRVCTTAGDVVMWGLEGSRHAANYKAYRALFLLLQTAPYRLIRLSSAKAPGAARLAAFPRAQGQTDRWTTAPGFSAQVRPEARP
jgi:hypothetical protein